jgi:TIR domain-containing protein
MPKLFISYRREDSTVVAGRIFDRLQAHLGRSSVFMDVDSIPYGADFRKHLTDMVAQCDLMLVLIGVDWLKAQADGRRRIDDLNDFVRIEIKAALDLGIRVVPILLGQTMMPLEDHLPEEIRDLAYLQAAQVDPGKDFHLYMDRVLKKLDQLLAQPRVPTQPAAPAQSPASAPAAVASRAPSPEPALEELVKSVQTAYGNVNDNRGQVFAKLKIALGKVEAVFGYLESLLDHPDDALVEKATVVLVKHCPHPSGRVTRQALLAMQTSNGIGVRYVLAREMASLLQANRASWDAELQGETLEALKFVAGYDASDMVRRAAIEALVLLASEDCTDFLISIVRRKQGIGETTPDWTHAVSTLVKSGDTYAARALAQLCTEPRTDLGMLVTIVYWVKSYLYRFVRLSNEVKLGLSAGAKAVMDQFEAVRHEPYEDAALILLMCFNPEEAEVAIPAFLDPGDPARRNAVCRSLASVEGQAEKKRFFRRLKENQDAARILLEALQSTAADPDSDEHLKKYASTAMNLLQSA